MMQQMQHNADADADATWPYVDKLINSSSLYLCHMYVCA